MYNKIHNHCIYVYIFKIITFFKNIIFFLSQYNTKLIELTRKEYNIIAKTEVL